MITKEEQKEVAQIILQQLGGNKFIVMTGSNNFVFGEKDGYPYLEMRLTRNKGSYKKLRITYAYDVYTLWFFSYNETTITKEKKIDGVYDDMLQEIFTEETGLYTHL